MAAQRDRNGGDTFDYVIVGSGRRRLRAGQPADRGRRASPSACWNAGRRTGIPTSTFPAGFIKMLFNPTYTWQFTDRAGRGNRRAAHPHHAGPHAGRLELDQRHGLQPRPARRFRQLGAARQSRLGLCRRAAVFQAHRAAHRRRRRPLSMAARATCRSPTWTGSIRSARRSSPARSAPGIPRNPDYNRRPARRASAISSARSTAVGGIPRRACSCIRRGRADVWMCAPMRARRACCSTANARSACAMSTIATARRACGARAARGDPLRAAP